MWHMVRYPSIDLSAQDADVRAMHIARPILQNLLEILFVPRCQFQIFGGHRSSSWGFCDKGPADQRVKNQKRIEESAHGKSLPRGRKTQRLEFFRLYSVLNLLDQDMLDRFNWPQSSSHQSQRRSQLSFFVPLKPAECHNRPLQADDRCALFKLAKFSKICAHFDLQ